MNNNIVLILSTLVIIFLIINIDYINKLYSDVLSKNSDNSKKDICINNNISSITQRGITGNRILSNLNNNPSNLKIRYEIIKV